MATLFVQVYIEKGKIFANRKIPIKPTFDIKKLILTRVNDLPDSFFESEISDNWKLKDFVYKEYKENEQFIYVRNNVYNERNQLALAKKIINKGTLKNNRTGIDTVSLFAESITFDISETIPVLTTRRIAWKTAITEMLFFLSGKSDTLELEKQNIKIWQGNTSREFLDSVGLKDIPVGQLNFGYGHQIRHFGGKSNCQGGHDQLKYITDLIENDPNSRRILWNLWNLGDLNVQTLPACHLMFQIYISENEISGHLTMRSQDYALANNFNTINYTVFIYILALKYGYTPGKLTITMTDCHIYKNHIEQTNIQLNRSIKSSPKLILNPDIKNKDWSEITIDDFSLVGYFPHPSIKMDMAI